MVDLGPTNLGDSTASGGLLHDALRDLGWGLLRENRSGVVPIGIIWRKLNLTSRGLRTQLGASQGILELTTNFRRSFDTLKHHQK